MPAIPVQISIPSVDVQGLCFVQQGANVALFARKANGDLEGNPAMIFKNDGAGVQVFLGPLSVGSIFRNDSGHILAES